MVKVDEPDDDTACLMLRGLKSRYAEHHGVHITDEAVKAAVTLSRRYLTGRQLPDKAVDLLDICLFGEMMSRFFALYTDIYLFNRLIIILQPTGERLEWEEKHNRRIPG